MSKDLCGCGWAEKLEEERARKHLRSERLEEKAERFGLPAAPSFCASVQELIATEPEPSVFSEQGKPRGRKPKAAPKAAAKAKAGARRGKGKKHRKAKGCKGKKETKVQRMRRLARLAQEGSGTGSEAVTVDSSAKATTSSGSKTATKAKGKAKKGKEGAMPASASAAAGHGANDELPDWPEHHGPRRLVPAHLTAHQIYSNAYRKNQHRGGDFARAAARLATEMFKNENCVDDLCGTFREKPRAKPGA